MYTNHPQAVLAVLECFAAINSDSWLRFEGLQADVAISLLGAHYIKGHVGTKPEHFYRDARGRRVVVIHGWGLEPKGHELLEELKAGGDGS
jgi:hypothetical protein